MVTKAGTHLRVLAELCPQVAGAALDVADEVEVREAQKVLTGEGLACVGRASVHGAGVMRVRVANWLQGTRYSCNNRLAVALHAVAIVWGQHA